MRCPGQGTDHHWGWTCQLQWLLSFHSTTEPASILLCFPPFIAVNVPLPRGKRLVLRAGFRYDKNWEGYIFPEAAAKRTDHVILY